MKFVNDGIKFNNYEGDIFIKDIEHLGFKKGGIPWEQFRTPWKLSFMLYPNRQNKEISITFEIQPFNNKFMEINLLKSSGKCEIIDFLCEDINDIIYLIKLSSGVNLSLK